jgi:hypothetical protein
MLWFLFCPPQLSIATARLCPALFDLHKPIIFKKIMHQQRCNIIASFPGCGFLVNVGSILVCWSSWKGRRCQTSLWSMPIGNIFFPDVHCRNEEMGDFERSHIQSCDRFRSGAAAQGATRWRVVS